MPFVNLSPNMNLPVPQVGIDPGPQFATDVNSCLTLVDAHDHSNGYGVKVSPDGLNISSDLTFNNNNGIDFRSIRFTSQGAVLTLPGDLGCLYVVDDDLYYNDELGNNIRLTQSGSIAGPPGSITGLFPPASASYSSSSSTFIWQSDVNTSAFMDSAAITLRNLTAGSNGVTINPPASIPSDFQITLPSLPASDAALVISSTGLITAQVGAFLPTGTVLPFAGASAPVGFLICDGSAVSRTTYAALFAVIGVVFGVGDGSTTFNVPDSRGRTVIGVGTGPGLSSYVMGQTPGTESVAISVAQMPSHAHGGTASGSTSSDGSHAHNVVNGNTNQPLTAYDGGGSSQTALDQNADPGGGTPFGIATDLAGTHSHTVTATIPSQGNDNGHPNIQPSIALNYMIKT